MLIEPNSRMVMIGDSITDCGRTQPIGEGTNGGLGDGYVLFTEALIDSKYTKHQIRVTNMGISGNTSRDLLSRWQTDVIDLKPDWVTILIGINDIWRKFDRPKQKEIHVPIEEYKENVKSMIERTKEAGSKVVLMTPFYLEPNKEDAMRAMSDQYGQICIELAREYGLILVDLQSRFNEFMVNNYPAVLSPDRVHPNTVGHMMIANEFLKAVDYEW